MQSSDELPTAGAIELPAEVRVVASRLSTLRQAFIQQGFTEQEAFQLTYKKYDHELQVDFMHEQVRTWKESSDDE